MPSCSWPGDGAPPDVLKVKSSAQNILVSSPSSSASRMTTVVNGVVSMKPRNRQLCPIVASVPEKFTRSGLPSTVKRIFVLLPRYQPPKARNVMPSPCTVKPSGTGCVMPSGPTA